MLTLEPQPTGQLHENGTVSGVPLPPEANIGIPTDEFQQEIMSLLERGEKPDRVLAAIDAHPEITDKPAARRMAEAIIKILE